MTFRRPECTLGGDDGQEVIIHPPEVVFNLSKYLMNVELRYLVMHRLNR